MALDVLDGGGNPQTIKSSNDSGDHVPHYNVDTLPSAFTTDTGLIKTAVQALAAIITGGRLPVDLTSTVTGYFQTLAATVASNVIQAAAPDTVVTGTLANTNDAVTVAMAGRPYAGVACGAGFSGQLTAEASLDGGTNWIAIQVYSIGAPPVIAATTIALSGTVQARSILVPMGATHVRVRANVATSGSCTVSLRATFAGALNMFPQLDTLHTDLSSLPPAATIYSGNKNVTTAGTAVALAASQALTHGVRLRAKDANTGLIYIGGSGVNNGSDRLAPSEPTWIDINNLANVYIDAAVSGEGVTYSGW